MTDQDFELQGLRAEVGRLRTLNLPSLKVPLLSPDAPFLHYSTCAARDFLHPTYHAICKLLCGPPTWHRKQWEWVYVIYHLQRNGLLRAGAKGLGFGVGQESLPALFASLGCEVVATDAPEDDSRWIESGQHSNNRDKLRAPWMVPDMEFDRLVTHRPADMNAIPEDLTGFDFTWSSCCFEHLGSLQAGMDFVVNSVGRLKPGGVAVHTTEFNVGSNDQTLSEGSTVIYRKRDLEELVERLRDRGHAVDPFLVAPFGHHLDGHIDAAPYATPHLKLELGGYVTTSAGIVVRARAA